MRSSLRGYRGWAIRENKHDQRTCPDEGLAQDAIGLDTNLGHGLVVDVDKISGSRVDLKALVESQRRLKGSRSCAIISGQRFYSALFSGP